MTTHIKDLFSLEGKVAVVTGGAGHLGSAMSEGLAEAGAHVVIVSRSVDKCRKRAEKISRDNPEAFAVQTDVTDKASVRNMVDETMKKFGRFDILVNDAGGTTSSLLEDMPLEEWNQCLSVYLTGTFLCTQAVVEVMRKGGGGSIINISSMYGMVAADSRLYEDLGGGHGFLSPPHYPAAKGGVIQFTRFCASYLAKDKIRVNTISPGAFPNLDFDKHREFIDRLSRKNMLNRIGRPWELKGAVLFLSSEASSYVTGQNIVVDGGWTAW